MGKPNTIMVGNRKYVEFVHGYWCFEFPFDSYLPGATCSICGKPANYISISGKNERFSIVEALEYADIKELEREGKHVNLEELVPAFLYGYPCEDLGLRGPESCFCSEECFRRKWGQLRRFFSI